MQEIYFGIASYRRPDNQRTLDYLERMGIDREHIIMTVQSAEDKAQYERAGIGNRVGRLIYRHGKNVSDNRNTLLESVPPGTRLVMLDDDINAVCKLDGKGLRKIESREEFYSFYGIDSLCAIMLYGGKVQWKYLCCGFYSCFWI